MSQQRWPNVLVQRPRLPKLLPPPSMWECPVRDHGAQNVTPEMLALNPTRLLRCVHVFLPATQWGGEMIHSPLIFRPIF